MPSLPLWVCRQRRRCWWGMRLRRKGRLMACGVFLCAVGYSVLVLLLPLGAPAASASPPRALAVLPPRHAAGAQHGHLIGPAQAAADAEALRTTSQRREKVRDMMRLAWRSYKEYAWGHNELSPIAKRGHSAAIFGRSKIGATIIDAVDTLWVMGLEEEYKDARDWIRTSFNLSSVQGDLSVFETNIRFLGGLLSIYALTKDEVFKAHAKAVGDILLPAFDSPTGIPYGSVNPRTRKGHVSQWASSFNVILAELGTLQLEFHYLSDITGDPVYFRKVERIREVLNSLDKPDGLYPNYLNPRTGKWGTKHVSMGAMGDSFYEYLLKSWLITQKEDQEARVMYEAAVEAIEKYLKQTSPAGLVYLAEMKDSELEHRMDHLACFSVGMFALQGEHAEEPKKSHYLKLAADLAHTCHESYVRSATGIGPETFRFTDDAEAKAQDGQKHYLLRPEAVEGWFYMWRVTGEAKYREWCWEAVEALEKHCRTPDGYSGIRNVYEVPVRRDDVQQSFFLAETLKYLYLVFSDDDLPLHQWVFNTEAHPLPVRRSPNKSPPLRPHPSPTSPAIRMLTTL